MLHLIIGPRARPPNCNASNDKFVTKTAIGFSVSALSLVFSPRPQTVKTFFWSSPDFQEKFCSSAHDELFFLFGLRRSLVQNSALVDIPQIITYVLFIFIY